MCYLCQQAKMCRFDQQRSSTSPLTDLIKGFQNRDCVAVASLLFKPAKKPEISGTTWGKGVIDRSPSVSNSYVSEDLECSAQTTDNSKGKPVFDEIKRKWRSHQICAQQKVEASTRATWCGWLLRRRGPMDIIHRHN